MFSFLKDKLKKAIKSFSRRADEASEAVYAEASKQEDSDKSNAEKELSEIHSTLEDVEEIVGEMPEQEISETGQEEKKPVITTEQISEKRQAEEQEPSTEEPPDSTIPLQEHEALRPLELDKAKGEGLNEKMPAIGAKTKESAGEGIDAKSLQTGEIKEAEKEKTPPETVKPKKTLNEDARGFFTKIRDGLTKSAISEKRFDELFGELELALLENNTALEVIDAIKGELKAKIVNQKADRGSTEKVITESLKEAVGTVLQAKSIDIIQMAREKKPLVVAMVGINGSGKTTTIAKIIRMLQKNGLKAVIAASDTFRAAAIEQLEAHANNLNTKVIKHSYGSDPAAVAYDAISYAKSHSIDVVLIDTAGRLHNNQNLMDELLKIVRVAKPDIKIFVGESIAGNDCTEQAREYNDKIGIDGIILSKFDVDDKGGAALSVGFVTGKPILFLGTGQGYDDIIPFDRHMVENSLFS